jgi:predicted restriction endonuclease
VLGRKEKPMATTDQWLAKFAGLKVDKARGDPAPHKPLLLLVVLELAEQTPSFGDVLPLPPELAFRFSTCWGIVAHRRTQAPDVRCPFYHLKSDPLPAHHDCGGQHRGRGAYPPVCRFTKDWRETGGDANRV